MESALLLEPVDEILCGDVREPHEFIDGAATINNSLARNAVTGTSRIEEIGGIAHRLVGKRNGDWFSYRFTVKNKYHPHIIDIEFCDDREGAISARVTEQARRTYLNTGDVKMMRGSVSVATGGAFKPLTGKTQNLKLYYMPNYCDATIDIINASVNRPGLPIYRIRIFEVKEMPALKVPSPSGRLFGMAQENCPIALRSFYGGPDVESFTGGWGKYQHMYFGFYKSHYCSAANQIKWMRFCGENLWFPSVWMYACPFYPTDAMRHPSSSPKDDYFEFFLRMFGENDILMMPMFEFTAAHGGLQIFPHKPVTNQEVAMGADTNKLICKDGTQNTASSFCHPGVQKRYREIIRDFISRYGRFPSLAGIGVYAGPSRSSLDPMVTELDYKSEDIESVFDGSYDDVSMGMFEKFIGEKIPADIKDPDRFKKRYDWIKKNARNEFIEFRCQKLAELHKIIRDELISSYPNKEYWPVHFVPAPYIIETMKKKGYKVRDIYRNFGIDPELYKNQTSMLAAVEKRTPTYHYQGEMTSETSSNKWQESDDFHKTWDNADGTLFLLRNGFTEIMTTVPDGKKWPWGPCSASKADPCYNEAHRYFARYMTNCLLKTTPKVIISGGLQDEMLGLLGHYDRQWHFAAPFRSIPLGQYRTLTGSGLDKNISIRLSEKDGKYNFYVANPYWWNTTVSIALSKDGDIHDLVDNVHSNGASIKLNMRGYAINVFSTSAIPVSAETIVSDEATEFLKAQFSFFDCVEKISNTDFSLLRLPRGRAELDGDIAAARSFFLSGDHVSAINILNQPDLVELKNFCQERNKVKDAPQSVYRVDCGSFEKYTDRFGNVWLPDQASGQSTQNYGYTEPVGMTTDRETTGRKFSFPDYRIYTTERYGIKGYLFRVPSGKYTVRLHTMEGFKPDNGVYDPAVLINGKQEIKPYYIFSEVGFDKPLIKEATGIIVNDGIIRLEFETTNSRICGIEVIKGN